MPRILGDFRLLAGERRTVWAVDVDYSYHYKLGDPFAGWDFTFRNGGTISLHTEGSGIGVEARWLVNDATGVLQLIGGGVPSPPGLPGIGVAGGGGVNVINDGLVSVSGPENAIGLTAADFLLNRGTIRVEAGEVGYGAQIDLAAGFVNTGTIAVEAGLQAIGVESTSAGRHENYGTISTRATDPFGVSAAWFAYSFYSSPVELLNAGVMEGDYAYFSYGGGGLASVLAISDTIRNTSTGEMRGAISTAFGADVVINDGLITGPVLLGHGADLYDGADGVLRDVVDGGDGADTLIGGHGTDYLFGGHGRDLVLGGGGDDLIEGGRGSDALDGGDGIDTLSYLDSTRGVVVNLATGTATGYGDDQIRNFEAVLGSAWDDTVTGAAGGEVLEGLAGNDVLDGGKGDDILVGGRGGDRLTGGTGADIFAFSAGDGADVIEDFETTDVLSVHGYTVARSILQVGADTRIVLSDTDSILLRGVQASLLTGGRLTFSASPLAPEPTPAPLQTLVTGDPLVIEAGERLVLDEPNPSFTAGWYVGAIAIFLYQTQDTAGDRPSLWNAGEVNLHSSGANGDVIGVWNASTTGSGPNIFHNQATGVISVVNDGATFTAGAFYVAENAFNDGRIEARGGGEVWGIEVSNFTNTGEVRVHAGGVGWGVRGGTHLRNDGLIEVHSHEAGAGMLFTAGRTVINTGTIRVTDDTAAIDSMGISYSLTPYGGEYLLNTGVIEADYALRFGSVSDNHNPDNWNVQQLWNTGELRGRVSLSENREALSNRGLITGAIELRSGDDVFDGRGGTQTGGVDGGNGNDVIYGGAAGETLAGGSGYDEISGGGGADTLTGGGDMDRFLFAVGDGADVVTDFNIAEGDQIRLTGYSAWQSVTQVGADTLVRLSATDSILLRNFTASTLTTGQFWFNYSALPPAGAAPTPPAAPSPTAPAVQEPARPWTTSGDPGPVIVDSSFTGTEGQDVRVGGAGVDVMEGLGGYDALEGLSGDDRLSGGGGDDSLSGGLGSDRLEGGAGDDLLNGGRGDDVLDGGDGLDLADYSGAAAGVRVDLTVASDQNTLGAGVDRLVSIERLMGSGHDDVLIGTGTANQLFGGDGADRLEGGGGADYFDGGQGEDTVVFSGARSAYTLAWTDDAADGVTVTGADGVSRAVNAEWLQFADVRVSAARDIFTFTGGAGADTSTGTHYHDVMDGGGGDDVLNGLTGDDVLHGDDGADQLNVGAGNHRVFGDAGNDILTVRPTDATGTFALPSRPHTTILLDGGAGDDRIDFSAGGLAVDEVNVVGGAGDDVIMVSGAKEVMIDAGAGDDRIVLYECRGGLTVLGGEGRDTYQIAALTPGLSFHAPATIPDFQVGPGGDRFDPWAYMAEVFPGVAQGQNLFETGFMRLSQRGRWVDVEILTGPGPDDYWTTVTTLVDVAISQLSIENFVGMPAGSSLGPYGASGDDGDNVLVGNDQRNVLAGYDGADILQGGGGDDWLLGGLGPDTLYGGDGNDFIQTGGATDRERNVIGDGDVAYGGAGNDILMGGVINERLYGGTGDDIFDGYQIAYEFADEGTDSVFHTHSRTLEDNVENLFLSWTDGAHMQGQFDTFDARTGTGNAVNNRIVGASGADTLRGLGGHDRLEGLGGDDILTGDAGDDLLTGGLGEDRLTGGAGDDLIDGGLGNDLLDGGDGHDIVTVSGVASSYRLLMDGDNFILKGPDGGDRLTGVESIRFSDGRVLELNRMYGPDVDARAWADGRIPEALLSGGDRSGDRPLVLPGPAGDDMRVVKDAGGPEVLPVSDAGDGWIWKDSDAPLVLPGAEDVFVADGKGYDGPQVLPGTDDGTFAGAKGLDQPEVLPGLDENRLFTVDPVALLDRLSGQMLTVDEQGLVVDHYSRSGGWIPDGWSF